ncbi:hypothetical protein PanWU01x14_033110 [Parasponia andersonii]|uniref:Uncharacterized protein n=1 Tax=Parasponia andersonii TaxID=3476 RepID=A0A2P5DTL1_PARAD|nr:hypothetical protein PanWU01x14_033110 [Parasponia andersonii]
MCVSFSLIVYYIASSESFVRRTLPHPSTPDILHHAKPSITSGKQVGRVTGMNLKKVHDKTEKLP